MNRSVSLAAVAIGATLFGCQTQQQAVDQMTPDAQLVAQRRGAFELNCPAAAATVLSKEMIQTAMAGPFYNPPQRAEYTVGVSGCNKQVTYLVVCTVGGTGCIAAGARNNLPQQQ